MVRAGLLVLLALALLPGTASAHSRPRHVVLVDWDGFDPTYLDLAGTPNIDALARRGSLSIASGTYKTISNPARASMSTGAYPERHDNVAYVYDPNSNLVAAQIRNLSAETVMEALAAGGKTTASVQWYMVQNHGVTFGDPAHLYVEPGGDCSTRTDAAIDILNRRPVNSGATAVTVPQVPDFLALYCNELDALGHAQGPHSPSMGTVLGLMDQQLGRLVQATKDLGIYRDTTFILAADHGMTAWSKTLQPQVLDAVRALGYKPEIVAAGHSPRPDTDVIIAPFVRVGTISLRGAAANDAARTAIATALAGLPEVQRVLDKNALRALHASSLEGDMVVEARPPYAFVEADLPAGQEQGGHASLSELHMPLLVSGDGVCGRRPARDADLVDIAPTVTTLLRNRPPAQAQGRPLSELLCPAW
jgi:hypothetical protein